MKYRQHKWMASKRYPKTIHNILLSVIIFKCFPIFDVFKSEMCTLTLDILDTLVSQPKGLIVTG